MTFPLATTTGSWWRLFREIDGVTIVYVDLTPNAECEAAAIAWLDDEELVRRKRFLHPSPSRRYTLCRAALRAILCCHLECDNKELAITDGEFGKPLALLRGEPAEIGFNVSHSGSHGLIALSDERQVGVDVEELVTPNGLDSLIDSVLTPGEQSVIAATNLTDRTRDFLRLWTVKEALIKALGVGLSLDMSKVEVPDGMLRGEDSSIFRFPHATGPAWRVINLSNGEFAAAAAYEAVPSDGASGEVDTTEMSAATPLDQRSLQ